MIGFLAGRKLVGYVWDPPQSVYYHLCALTLGKEIEVGKEQVIRGWEVNKLDVVKVEMEIDNFRG